MKTDQVGDGKLPNSYWVSIADDYWMCRKDTDGAMRCDWISDTLKSQVKDKTLKRCPTFRMALGYANNLPFGEVYDGIRILNLTIEDRLSGQVWARTRHFYPETGHIHDEDSDETSYTRKEMAKRGAEFV